MSKHQMQPEHEATMNLFSIICAVMHSDKTPLVTKAATMETLKHVFEDETNCFHANEEMEQMTAAMAQQANEIWKGVVKSEKSKIRVEEGKSILGGIDFSDN